MKKFLRRLLKSRLGQYYTRLVVVKHFIVAVSANIKRGFPAKGLKVIAVTGTDGKTTTCFMIYKMLLEAKYNTGLMTTTTYGLNEDLHVPDGYMTTNSIEITLNRIAEMKRQGLDYLVMEVTSQALDQFRVLGIPIHIAVLTNMSPEHLDYHRTFEHYRKSKVRLFKLAQRNRSGKRLGVINFDDETAPHFSRVVDNVVGYSLKQKQPKNVAWPDKLKLTPKGSRYDLRIDQESYRIECNLPGKFNVANSMAAVLVGRALGLSKSQLEDGIAALSGVEGRLEIVDAGQDFMVLVDFAHTPASYTKIFAEFKPLVKGRLITVFGCTGQRDTSKRPVMGKLASQASDITIITEDDNHGEDIEQITNHILNGIKGYKKHLNKSIFVINERYKAIEKAISLANKDDLVLLLGKGHEKKLYRDDSQPIIWSDVRIATEIIKGQGR